MMNTLIDWLLNDKRLGETVAIVKAKTDDQGCFTPESIWQVWREWDFGQKRAPSAWLTLIARRMAELLT
jgi:hypothetical protein